MKKLLLHSCCAPCSTAVIERLINDYNITIYYYNPNIDSSVEFYHRLEEEKRYCKEKNIDVIEDGYDENQFLSQVKGLENEKEGGARCPVCFKLRLKKTAEKAKELGFDIFTTTLSVSPYKNAEILNEIGKTVANEVGIEYLEANFKKKDGYKRSIELSRQYNLYRQNYCGCKFSKRDRSEI